MLLCMVSIKERVMIKSGLWWRAYGSLHNEAKYDTESWMILGALNFLYPCFFRRYIISILYVYQRLKVWGKIIREIVGKKYELTYNMRNSTILYPVKMEYGWNLCLKVSFITKIFIEIHPCSNNVIVIPEFVILWQNPSFYK